MYFGGKSKEIDPVKAFRVKTFPPVKRGAKVDVYMTTTGTDKKSYRRAYLDKLLSYNFTYISPSSSYCFVTKSFI